MRKEGNDKKQYTAADILGYLRGSLTPSEMHRIEKAAMEDPFLADAIAGLERNLRGHGAVEQDLQELHKRLTDRAGSGRKKSILSLGWRVAAACLLLAGAAGVTYFYLIGTGGRDGALATAEKTVLTVPAEDLATLPDSLSATAPESLAARSAAGLPPPPDSYAATAPESLAARSAAGLPPPPQGIPGEEEAARGSGKKADLPDDLPPPKTLPRNLSAVAPSQATPAPSSRPSVSPPGGDSGQNRGDGGIAAQLQGQAAGVAPGRSQQPHSRETLPPATDTYPVADEQAVVSHDLAKKAAKEETARLPARPNVLHEPAKRAVAERTQPGVENAGPAGGWEQWQQYINRNKKSPPADSVVTGTQTVSFVVDKNEKLSRFRMIHSLSPWHDAEVIRLLREGPAWKIQKGKQQVVTVSIRF